MIKEVATDKSQMMMVEVGDGATNVKSKQYQFFDKVKENLQQGVLNTPNIASTKIRVQPINVNKPQNLLYPELGYYLSSFFTGVDSLPNPEQFYKLSQIREVGMSVSIIADAGDLGGYSPPFGITNFSIDFYVSLVLVEAINGNAVAGFFASGDNPYIIGRLVTIPFTFTFSAVEPLAFTIANPVKNFRLSDTVNRTFVAGSPNFTTNPTKITTEQYTQLTTKNNILFSFFGWNDDQYLLLSAANKLLFDDFFNRGLGVAPNDFQLFGIGVEVSFVYFGIGATFG
jgi:hypothetical protein